MDILITGANGQVGSELQFLANQFPDFKFHFTIGLHLRNAIP